MTCVRDQLRTGSFPALRRLSLLQMQWDFPPLSVTRCAHSASTAHAQNTSRPVASRAQVYFYLEIVQALCSIIAVFLVGYFVNIIQFFSY